MWTYQARLDRVIDGDTFVLHLDLGFHIWTTQHVRLAGIDCPERSTRHGIEAGAFTRAWFASIDNTAIVTTEPGQPTSFERWIGRVSAPVGYPVEPDLAEALRRAGYVKAPKG